MAQGWENLFLVKRTVIFAPMAPLREDIVTGEQFYDYLKRELYRGQVLYITKDFGKGGSRQITFSGWEADGRLRFHMPDSSNPDGIMRFLRKEELIAAFKVYEPDNPKKLVQQLKKICGYRDIRKSVLQQLVVDYG